MTHSTPKIRSATTAIATALALSSTPLFAQSVDPVVAAPPPAAGVTPAPAAAPPLAAEPVVIDTTADPRAAEAVAKPAARKAAVTKTAPARPRPAAARAATAAPAVAAAPAAPVAEGSAAQPLPAEPVAAAPAVAAPVVTAPPAQDAPVASNIMLPIAGGAGLALLTLIGLLILRRRKRRNEEEIAAAEQYEAANENPAQPDPLFAEPAFVAAATPAGTPTECADAAPGSHVEAACEGPTEDNPSLSIRKRLKRAHFFDEREQLVAAGMAVPVAADAGLPDAVEVPEPVAPEPAPSKREPA
jgi:LPXTG-motif cell wall-anchored protein